MVGHISTLKRGLLHEVADWLRKPNFKYRIKEYRVIRNGSPIKDPYIVARVKSGEKECNSLEPAGEYRKISALTSGG